MLPVSPRAASFSGFVAGDGGAISSSGPALVISDSSFYGNKASKELGAGAGGAVFASSDAPGRVSGRIGLRDVLASKQPRGLALVTTQG